MPIEGHLDIWRAAEAKLATQIAIVRSLGPLLSDTLTKIRTVLRAELFDSEIDAARHLLKNGHLRAAGAVAGVVLEGHLQELASLHNVPTKKGATLAVFNDALRDAKVLDIPNWRWIQRLADIRNLCDHKKEREPTPDEVQELIDGTSKAIKTLF